ncbi:MAG: hypothetical protein SPI72_01935 [Porphyromonas sp.]|nr:hypothetical protein [Porphyromonas sp.]
MLFSLAQKQRLAGKRITRSPSLCIRVKEKTNATTEIEGKHVKRNPQNG